MSEVPPYGLIQQGPRVQSLVKDRLAELDTRLAWRRHTLQRLIDPRLLVKAELTDGTLLRTDLAPQTLTCTCVQAIVFLLLLHLSRPAAPSTHLRQTPSGVGVELDSEGVKIAEAGQDRWFPRTVSFRRTWKLSACLQMLITLPDLEKVRIEPYVKVNQYVKVNRKKSISTSKVDKS